MGLKQWIGLDKNPAVETGYNPDEGFNPDMYMKTSDLASKLNTAYPSEFPWNVQDAIDYQAMAHKVLSTENRNYTLAEFVRDHNQSAEKSAKIFAQTHKWD